MAIPIVGEICGGVRAEIKAQSGAQGLRAADIAAGGRTQQQRQIATAIAAVQAVPGGAAGAVFGISSGTQSSGNTAEDVLSFLGDAKDGAVAGVKDAVVGLGDPLLDLSINNPALATFNPIALIYQTPARLKGLADGVRNLPAVLSEECSNTGRCIGYTGIFVGISLVGSKGAGAGPSTVASTRNAELLRLAREARDAEAARRGSSKATVTGGYDPKTGRVAAGCNRNPTGCAEDDVVRKLGVPADQVMFTEAIRPRTGKQVPVCLSLDPPFCRGGWRG